MSDTCFYRSGYRDSGDRGADMHEHNRSYHPDHSHTWGDSTYQWEQIGAPYYRNGAEHVRTVSVQRCTICALAQDEDCAGRCKP